MRTPHIGDKLFVEYRDDYVQLTLNVAPFAYWINERHLIYTKRKNGEPGPWTDDPILRDYRFCNVFRELDTETIWIRQHIRERYKYHHNLWFLLAMARNVNWKGTLRDLLENTDLPDRFERDQWLEVFRQRKGRGVKIFGNGYLITNGGRSIPKEEYVYDYVLKPLWDATDAEHSRSFDESFRPIANGGTQWSLEEVWGWFRSYQGFGPFIAYEVVTDLRHTEYLCNAGDIMTWANAGPGALRGINRLAGRPLKAPLRPSTALGVMRALLALVNSPYEAPGGFRLLGEHVPVPMEMRDVEHSLCETDKYIRALTGDGKPKVQYDWRQATRL